MTVFKTSMRNFFAHKGRMALSAIAVMLSVAFVCGTLVFSDTATSTFDRLFNSTSADVQVSPAGQNAEEQAEGDKPQRTLPAADLEKVAGIKGVKSVEGDVVDASVTVANSDNDNLGSTTGAPTIATNWDRAERKSVAIASGNAPRGPDQVMIDKDAADKHDVQLGDTIRTIAGPGSFTAKVVGIAEFKATNPGATVVYFDTATAQAKLLGKPDAYSTLMVTAEPGFTNELLKKNVAAELGGAGTYKVLTKAQVIEEGKNDVGGFLDVMKYAMLGFAGIAVLVGIFLIVNTFSMLVAQRTREIGLLRALGSSRKQINRSVLTEALLLGVTGSVLGVGAGIGIAIGLMKLMSSAGMNLSTADLTIKTTTPVIGVVLGVVVTVIAAYLPARRAAKVSPMAALRDAGTPGDRKAGAVRTVLGLLLIAGGAAGLWQASQADKAADGSMFLAGGVLLSLLGFIVFGPVLAGVVVRIISAGVLRVFGPVGRMAERNALRNPRRTGATASALMIGLALVACLSVVGSSMVASATDELDKSVGADFIVQSNMGKAIHPEAAQAMKDVPQLAHVSEVKILEADLKLPSGKKVGTDVNAASPTYADDLRVETVAGSLKAAYGTNAMSVDQNFAKKHGVKVGDSIEVSFKDGRTGTLKLAAITSSDVALDKGAKYLSVATAARYLPAAEMRTSEMITAKAKEGQADAAYAALKKDLKPYPQYEVRDQADYKQQLKDQVGQMLNLVNGLLALAIIVAVLGVVNTLALSVVERTREIGLMRAIGLSRRQLRRMIRLESVVIAIFGAVLGVGLGMAWGATAQQLLALEGLKVLDIPWPTIAWVFAGSALVGILAALFPAFRAGRMNVLNAIATE
ncbi:FtsX-like permease family protein [Streptomyces sp. A7024]|uniref:FtsX-like permease family protein n=1 Tax=Streptomyces coryli TaxID=1128680 RepID=A0A6G4U2K9_9ACTN|nr:FtsX-like permease family protein [Streptomyces coryli]NGN66242.1 FtsX-like permease family protein [Streptomyces coryli]